ncbi:tyrosine-type recombinase/integrase [Alsobacter metallidurans]|uniref:tyrosine-type recombinase/integrase n=1 Tax=Alsobacter metallidurans TaxID=340221 RepID=UPI001FCF1043|nr:site-specific integrase [Alsobacter metallidurans]
MSADQARDRARSWAKAIRAGGVKVSPTLTVGGVVERYIEAREAEGMKSVYDARSRFRTHISPKLGGLMVTELTLDRLTRWRNEMAKSAKRLRTAKGAAKQNIREIAAGDSDGLRRRRDTANRTLTLLKAALNWARDHRLVDDDSAWRLTKPFRGTTAARVRFLDINEQQRLLDSVEGPLRDLIAAALMTGARFGELARLSARDFDPTNGTIFIAESKSGKARHVPLTPGGATLFARLARGKAGEDPLLSRIAGERWKPATYQRSFKEALQRAGLDNLTLHELRHSYASAMVRAGAPLIVVAEALGHSDTRMAEKHYAHLAPSFVADTIRRTAPNLLLPELPLLKSPPSATLQ